VLVKDPKDVSHAREAARKVVQTHQALAAYLRPGLTMPEIDEFVGKTLSDLSCESCFLGYRVRGHPPFPSHACLSLNDCVVHGTHFTVRRGLQKGDLFSVDVGVRFHGWIGDAAWTYSIGRPDPLTHELMEAGRESLRRGIEAMQPHRPLINWAKAVQGCVEQERKLHLVRGLGGHGIGRTLHGPPYIANVVPTFPGEWNDAWKPWTPGMLVAVEPMIAAGTTETRTQGREWPIWTADGSQSVHYEADVLITETGPENLTAELFDLPDVIEA
jgi:methionyl aminopeptidase